MSSFLNQTHRGNISATFLAEFIIGAAIATQMNAYECPYYGSMYSPDKKDTYPYYISPIEMGLL